MTAFTENQLLDFQLHVQRAAIDAELVGGDTKLIDIAEQLLQAVEDLQHEKNERVEAAINDADVQEDRANKLQEKLQSAAEHLMQIGKNRYSDSLGVEVFADDESFKKLTEILSD